MKTIRSKPRVIGFRCFLCKQKQHLTRPCPRCRRKYCPRCLTMLKHTCSRCDERFTQENER